MVRPSADQSGKSSRRWSPSRVSGRACPSGRSLIQSRPRLSNTTRSPSGETRAKRVMRVSTVSGATSIRGRIGSTISRVSFTSKGMTVTSSVSMSMRLIRPPAQNTIERESGVQSIVGYMPFTPQVSWLSWSRSAWIRRTSPERRFFR